MPVRKDFETEEEFREALLDYFASHAKESDIEYYKTYRGGDHEMTILARTREQAKYAYADAMLKERRIKLKGGKYKWHLIHEV